MELKVLLLVFFSVQCQPPVKDNPINPPKPDRCNRPTEFMYRQCCVFPPFFTRTVAQACGAKIELLARSLNITTFRRQPTTLCDHWRCVLDRYSLLNEDDTLNDEKYFAHLDRWIELNPQFTTVIINAKVHCKNLYRMYLPLKVCEFFNIHGCIRNFVNVDCPVIFPTKACEEVKSFYDECREYYL